MVMTDLPPFSIYFTILPGPAGVVEIGHLYKENKGNFYHLSKSSK